MNVEQLRAEADRLRQAAGSHEGVWRTLAQVTGSAGASARAEEFRRQWEGILEQRGRLLDIALGRLRELEEANRKLTTLAAEFAAAHKRLLIQFRQQLGVVPKSLKAPKGPAEDEDRADLPPSDAPPRSRSGPRKRGAPVGHRGASRPIPPADQVREVRVVPPPTVCSCGCREIQPVEEFDDVYWEDIPPVVRVYTRVRHQRGRCRACGAKLRHQAAVAGPPALVGPNLGVALTLMRQAGLTYRKLASLSTDLFDIPLTPAGVLGIVSRNAERLRPAYTEIKAVLPREEVLNIDETGWKIHFSPAYIWCLCNSRLAWFHADPSRAGEVVRGILGKDFPGTVVCDFYRAYNFLPHLQRCLVHFLRDLHLERAIRPASAPLERFHGALQTIIDHGRQIAALEAGPEKDKRLNELNRELDAIIRMKLPKGKPDTLRARLDRHRGEILTFARTPGVPYHNNRAERQIRPTVVNRKNSFGSASQTGAEHTCILNSVVETCRLNHNKPVQFLRAVFLSGALPSVFTGDRPALRC